jgi:hypothetical protein
VFFVFLQRSFLQAVSKDAWLPGALEPSSLGVLVARCAERVPIGCGLARFSRAMSSGSMGTSVGRFGAGAQISLGSGGVDSGEA